MVDTGVEALKSATFTAFDDETVNSGIDGFQGSLQRGNDVVNGQTGGFQRCCVLRW